MSSSAIKYPKRLFSQTGGDASLPARVITLENNEYKITYFAEISSSTGTITVPTGATILLDQFQGGIDAYVCTIQNGQPTGNFPQTSLGVTVDVTSFDALGNYTLSGTPSSYPVALIYILKIKAKDYSNLDITKILDLEGFDNKGVNVIYRNFTTGAALTGTTAITLINSALIPANTIAVNDEVEIKARAQRNTTIGTANHYLYYNTSPSLSGATLIGSHGAAAGWFAIVRSLYVRSSSDSETINSSFNGSTSETAAAVTTTATSLNINLASDVYIVQAFANANNADTTTSRGMIIKRARL